MEKKRIKQIISAVNDQKWRIKYRSSDLFTKNLYKERKIGKWRNSKSGCLGQIKLRLIWNVLFNLHSKCRWFQPGITKIYYQCFLQLGYSTAPSHVVQGAKFNTVFQSSWMVTVSWLYEPVFQIKIFILQHPTTHFTTWEHLPLSFSMYTYTSTVATHVDKTGRDMLR